MEYSLNILHVIQTNNAKMYHFADKYGKEALIEAINNHAFHYYIGGSLIKYYTNPSEAVQIVTEDYVLKAFKNIFSHEEI
jgi:hypothetical protein